MDRHDFADGTLAASVLAQGAELCSLQSGGHELIWQAGPVWPRHAPVLFPIVGRLANDTLRHQGATYPMTQHGFARDMRFTWLDRGPTSCRLVLMDDAATSSRYPFPFRLELTYGIASGTLEIEYLIVNTGDTILPAAIGAHPAFRWPLFDGVAKTDHAITFEQPEPDPIGRLRDGLLLPERAPTPITNATLPLSPELFAQDALILMQPGSRWVCYTAPKGRGLRVTWHGMTQLGIWSKPGDFVCIEPWHGYASPTNFGGDIMDKPGMLLIPPGEERRMGFCITPEL